MFIRFDGDWTILKDIANMHYVDLNDLEGRNFYEKMAWVHKLVMQALKNAQSKGVDYVMFNHGHSFSGSYIMTARSMVRSIMSSKEAAPYIVKKKSIQHKSVFVAAIKPGVLSTSILP